MISCRSACEMAGASLRMEVASKAAAVGAAPAQPGVKIWALPARTAVVAAAEPTVLRDCYQGSATGYLQLRVLTSTNRLHSRYAVWGDHLSLGKLTGNLPSRVIDPSIVPKNMVLIIFPCAAFLERAWRSRQVAVLCAHPAAHAYDGAHSACRRYGRHARRAARAGNGPCWFRRDVLCAGRSYCS